MHIWKYALRLHLADTHIAKDSELCVPNASINIPGGRCMLQYFPESVAKCALRRGDVYVFTKWKQPNLT